VVDRPALAERSLHVPVTAVAVALEHEAAPPCPHQHHHPRHRLTSRFLPYLGIRPQARGKIIPPPAKKPPNPSRLRARGAPPRRSAAVGGSRAASPRAGAARARRP